MDLFFCVWDCKKPVSEKPVSEKPVTETSVSAKPVSEKPVQLYSVAGASKIGKVLDRWDTDCSIL